MSERGESCCCCWSVHRRVSKPRSGELWNTRKCQTWLWDIWRQCDSCCNRRGRNYFFSDFRHLASATRNSFKFSRLWSDWLPAKPHDFQVSEDRKWMPLEAENRCFYSVSQATWCRASLNKFFFFFPLHKR